MIILSKAKRNIFSLFVGLASSAALFSCGGSRQSTVTPMQQTMDSLKMWYTQMEGDSMEAKSIRIKDYLDQHQNDKSEALRRLRAEWLKAQGVYYTALKGQPDSGLIYTELALEEMQDLQGVDESRVLALANRADFYRQLFKM